MCKANLVWREPPNLILFRKITCTGDRMEQLYVTREAIEAYERRTGFQGLGQFMIDKGLFVMTEENTCKTA